MMKSLVPWVAPAALLLAACGGEPEGSGADAPPPIVIEGARARVQVGSDTVLVSGPTLFAFFTVDPTGTRLPAGGMEAAGAFQDGVQGAQASLAALGVRVIAVDQTPVALDGTPGTGFGGGSLGYLFVDAAGHVLEVADLQNSAGLVCAAARAFGLTLDGQQSAACG